MSSAKHVGAAREFSASSQHIKPRISASVKNKWKEKAAEEGDATQT
jgi:hypothetical protein